MKKVLLSIFLFGVFCQVKGQGIDALKAAINDPQKKVQVLHHYPENIKDGECHFVEAVSIVVSGNNITIEERWSNWLGAKATTTLSGTIANNVATGEWTSTYSGGSWSYDFSNNKGSWNKIRGRFDPFTEREKLDLKIVSNEAIKDGFYACGQKH